MKTENCSIYRVKDPMKTSTDYWVYALSDNVTSTKRSGKWMLFVHKDNLLKAWQKIALATKRGELGNLSKSATAKFNSLAKDQEVKLICVYTRDSEDINEVIRVLTRLRELGFDETIYYKTDEATRKLNYGEKSWKYCSDQFASLAALNMPKGE